MMKRAESSIQQTAEVHLMISISDAKCVLAEQLLNAADWRLELAKQYPQNVQNLLARGLLLRLAEACLNIDESEPGPNVRAFAEYIMHADQRWTAHEADQNNDYFGQIGFRNIPDDPGQLCADLLRAYCARREDA